jgi:rubredoxin
MFKTFLLSLAALLIASSFSSTTRTEAFVTNRRQPASHFSSVLRTDAATASTSLNLFGGPKDDGKPGDYVCLDCGYVFTRGPKAWAELPDSWSCPPCGSVKRRFKKVPKGRKKP